MKKILLATAIALSATAAHANPVNTQVSAEVNSLSNFSVKGIRFGMTAKDFDVIISPLYDNRWSYNTRHYCCDSNPTKEQLIAWMEKEKKYTVFPEKYSEFISILNDPNYKVEVKDGPGWLNNELSKFFKELTIGGIRGWKDSWHDDKLTYIYKDIEPSDYSFYVSSLSAGYGKPTVQTEQLVSNMGVRVTNVIATWKVKDATITVEKYNHSIIEGRIQIKGNAMYNQWWTDYKNSKKEAAKDF
jgi:hypothetical protein